MNQEVLFAKTLEEVKKTAKEQGGCISEEQVKEAFAPLGLDEAQLALVYDFLEKHKIGIGEPVNADDYLSDLDKSYLEEYFNELQSMERVTPGEAEAITLSAMAGDTDAQKKLIEIYLPQAVDLAKLYSGQGVPLEDLVAEGNVALVIGVTMLGCLENAAEAQGMLGKMMMDAMEEFIEENAKESQKDKRIEDKVNKVADAARSLAEDLGRKVTPAELAAETGMNVKAIEEAMRISGFKIEDLESGE
ncbi:MAG: hypothetical protein IJ282_00580 [Lachnospiraceae bacterium]|nr:hypothetical protein [Lachnospiraceae bacterium]